MVDSLLLLGKYIFVMVVVETVVLRFSHDHATVGFLSGGLKIDIEK